MKFVYKGIIFKSYKELCDCIGLSYYTFRYRYKQGWSIDKIVNNHYRKKRRKKTEKYYKRSRIYNGVYYKTSKELCNTIGVSYRSIYYRINKGMCFDDAIKDVTRKNSTVM